jgi:hypothetical protein
MPRPTVSTFDRARSFQRLPPARIVAVLITAFLFSSVAYATAVPLAGDTFVSRTRPTTNFGTLYIGIGNTALMQFDLSGLSTFPGGITKGQIARATLTIFVNRVNTAGTVSLSTVASPWIESGQGG